MNAERLHAIAKAIQTDLDDTNVVSLLQQLTSALQNQVSQPQQPQFQQEVSETRVKLDEALAAAPSNGFSPAWREILKEIAAAELLGTRLRDRIEEIFSRNQITPATAAEETQEMLEKLQQLSQSVANVLSGLGSLKIGAEDLAEGECELGVLVPRSVVANQLRELGAEFERLQKIFAPFAELASGSRPEFEIRTVSSSDFNIFFDLGAEVAACVAFAVERLVALYKQLLEIRRLRQELSEQGLPEKSLGSIDDHANTHMRDGIETLGSNLVEEFGADREKGRKNELLIEIKLSLNQIANRIDNGYNIDVRANPPSIVDDDEHDDHAAVRGYFDTIGEASEELQYINLTGAPILSLPEPPEESQEDDGKS